MARERDWEEDMPAPSGAAPAPTQPYLALWAEVLRTAFEDARRYLTQRNRLSAAEMGEGYKALRWLWNDASGVGSLHWVCSWFDLEPAAVRRSLAERAGVKLAVVERALGHQVAAAD